MATVAAGDGRLTNLTNVILTGTDDRTVINDMTNSQKMHNINNAESENDEI